VPTGNVEGRICLYVPFLGYAIEFLKTTAGFSLALVVPGLAFTGMYVRSLRRALIPDRREPANKAIQL
jgi:hypothetical protein